MGSSTAEIKKGVRHRAGGHSMHPAAVNDNDKDTLVAAKHLSSDAVNDNEAFASASRAEKTKPGREEKAINRVKTVQNWLFMPWNLELAAMVAGPVKWVFEKVKWTGGHVLFDALVINPMQALQKTTLGTLAHFRANYVGARAESVVAANDVASNIHQNWEGTKAAKAKANAEELARKAKTLHSSANERGATIASSSFVSGIRKSVGNAIDSFARTGFGKSIEGGLKRFFDKRHAKLIGKHSAKMEAAHGAFSTELPKGFLKGLFGGAKSNALVEVGPHLQPHLDKLAAAPALHGDPQAHIHHVNQVLEDLREFAARSAPKGDIALVSAQQRAGAVVSHLEEMVHHAGGVHIYNPENAVSLRGMAKGLMASVGRVPVFHALVAAGTVAGLVAVTMTAKKESHEAKTAYGDMVDDLGGDAKSPYLQAVNNAYAKQKRGGVIKTGANAIAEAATLGMVALPGGAAMAMMAPSMLPAMVPMFVPENELLNAYAALKQEEAGKIQLEPAQKLQCVKHLVAGLPSVASHGGAYNVLVTPVAEEIMNRKLSVKDTLQLINNEQAFNAIASAAYAKQKEAQAASHADHAPAKTHEGGAMVSTKQSAESAYKAAEKPASSKVTGAKEVQGKVNQNGLAMANA